MASAIVTIAGGGPAAAAAAIELARSGQAGEIVLVRPEDDAATDFGESIPPPGRQILAALGVWEEFEVQAHRECMAFSSCWGSERRAYHDFIFDPAGRGWQLRRDEFDRMLLAAAEREGATIIAGKLHSAEPVGAGWKLRVRKCQSGKEFHRHADFLIDATGRRSVVARGLGAERRLLDTLCATFLEFDFDPDSADGTTLVEACETGWCFSTPTASGGFVSAFMTDSDIARQLRLKETGGLQNVLQSLPESGKRIASLTVTGKPIRRPAHSFILDRVAGSNWLATGDAACAFDPLSSHGIVKALISGREAGIAVSRALQGDQDSLNGYETWLRGQFEKYLQGRREYYAAEDRWPGSPFWRRRHERIELDPNSQIDWRSGSLPPSIPFLTRTERLRLMELCKTSRSAHRIVRDFPPDPAAGVTDHRLILALQDLVSRGQSTESDSTRK